MELFIDNCNPDRPIPIRPFIRFTPRQNIHDHSIGNFNPCSLAHFTAVSYPASA